MSRDARGQVEKEEVERAGELSAMEHRTGKKGCKSARFIFLVSCEVNQRRRRKRRNVILIKWRESRWKGRRKKRVA